jgi:pheromone shutdown protein TraB
MDSELILIGTGHVFDIGKKIVTIIEKEDPDAIAIELDVTRATALQSGNRTVKKRAISLYYLMAKVQAIIAKKFKVSAGDEMRSAITMANNSGIPLFYIDMDAKHILNKLWNCLSFKKKVSLLVSVFLSLFMRKKNIEAEIKTFENNPADILDQLEAHFPELKKVLIDERNEYMVKQIKKILSEEIRLMVIVGEGHIQGISELLNNDNIKHEIIHLSQILKENQNGISN